MNTYRNAVTDILRYQTELRLCKQRMVDLGKEVDRMQGVIEEMSTNRDAYSVEQVEEMARYLASLEKQIDATIALSQRRLR